MEQSLQLHKRDGEAVDNRGVLALAQGKASEARSRFEKALSLAPYLGAAAYNLGLLATESTDLATAEDWLCKASAALPDERADLALGVVLGKQGKCLAAEGLLLRAANSETKEIRDWAEESLALVLWGSGQTEKARPRLEALLKGSSLPRAAQRHRSAPETVTSLGTYAAIFVKAHHASNRSQRLSASSAEARSLKTAIKRFL